MTRPTKHHSGRYSILNVCRLCVISMICIFSQSLFAAGHAGYSKVTKLAFQTGGLYIYGPSWNNPNNCSQKTAIVLKNTDPNYEKAYALILAAYMSGKKIGGYSDECTDFDEQTYNTIRGFKYLTVE